MRATRVCFEKRYRDTGGIEAGVRLTETDIEFESGGLTIFFPVEELSWLVAALCRIEEEVER